MQVHAVVPSPKGPEVKHTFRRWRADGTRFSADKFLAYRRFCRETSRANVAWALVSTPLVGLAGAIVPAFVPLQDPLLGPIKNVGFWGNLFVTVVIITMGLLMHVQAGAEIPPELYSPREAIVVSVVVSFLHTLACLALAVVWTFPIPGMWVSTINVWVVMLTVVHVVALWRKLRASNEIQTRVLRYLPALTIQCTQVVVYPAFSILFQGVGSGYQILLTLVFPIVKYGMKIVLRRFARGLNDFSSEVAVSGVEICAALYQSMIMQSAPSELAMGVILGLDVIQGLVSVKLFMDKPTSMPKKDLIEFASHTLEAEQAAAGTARNVGNAGSRKKIVASDEDATGETSRSADATQCVAQALHLMHVAESILLVEYLEVAIPTTNAVFLLLASSLPTAVYNDRLCRFYHRRDELAHAVQATLLYSLLQGVTLVAMHFVLQLRYGISGARLLAFVLQWHRKSICGKLLAWVPLILHFTVVHYGTDFSFRFDFAAMVHELRTCGDG